MELFFQSIVLYFQENPVAQIIGFVAVLVNIIAFATSKDKKFLIFMAISSGIWGVHFFLMNLFSAAFISFFDIAKNLIALKYKKNLPLISFLAFSYVIIAVFTFDSDNIFSIIPIINSLLSVYFVFFLEGIKLKLGFLLILVFWFVYNFFGHSLGGMTSDVILFVSGIYGLYKMLQSEKKPKTEPAK